MTRRIQWLWERVGFACVDAEVDREARHVKPVVEDPIYWLATIQVRPGSEDTFEIGFLRGKRTPTVERGETDFNTLGLWFRVYFDLGVREQDHRGMVKSNGAA